MTFPVRQTDQADCDLADILQWLLEQQAGDSARLWFDGLQEAIESLCESPKRCSFAPESKEFGYEVRQLIYGKKPYLYRILFTIEEDTVVILHIRHGRRLPFPEGE